MFMRLTRNILVDYLWVVKLLNKSKNKMGAMGYNRAKMLNFVAQIALSGKYEKNK